MYLEHFGFTEKPFKLKSDARFYFDTPAQQRLRRQLAAAIAARAPLITLTGAAGSGKTSLLKRVLDDLDGLLAEHESAPSVARVVSVSGGTRDFADIIALLYRQVATQDDAAAAHNLGTQVQRLQSTLLAEQQLDQTTLLVIDDAENFDGAVLGDIVSLGRRDGGFAPAETLFIPLLIGLPAVVAAARPVDGGAVDCRIEAFAADAVQGYIDHQLEVAGAPNRSLFTPNSMEQLVELSRGNPRTVNSLCDAALFIASMEDQSFVTPEILDRAAQQCFLKQPERVNYYDSELAAGASADAPAPLQPQSVSGLSERDARQALGLRFGDVSAELQAAGVDTAEVGATAPRADAASSLDRAQHAGRAAAPAEAATDRLAATALVGSGGAAPATTLPPAERQAPSQRRQTDDGDRDLLETELELELGRQFGAADGSGPPTIDAVDERIRQRIERRSAPPEPFTDAPPRSPRRGRRWPLWTALLLVGLAVGVALLRPQWLGMSREQIDGRFDQLRAAVSGWLPQTPPVDLGPESAAPVTANDIVATTPDDATVADTAATPIAAPSGATEAATATPPVANPTARASGDSATTGSDAVSIGAGDTSSVPVATAPAATAAPVTTTVPTAPPTAEASRDDSLEALLGTAPAGATDDDATTPSAGTAATADPATDAAAATETGTSAVTATDTNANADAVSTTSGVAETAIGSVAEAAPTQSAAEALAAYEASQTAAPADTADAADADAAAGAAAAPADPELERLLTQAERQIGNNLLTTPADDNAFDTYQTALTLSPGNRRALDGLERIKTIYIGWAESSRRQNRLERARDYYRKALKIDPDDGAVRQALADLDSRLGG